VKPDIIVSRLPVSDEEINRYGAVVGDHDDVAKLTPLRHANREAPLPLLHASISCKWTVRSDRSQNSRTEALNLIRNRKGSLPHVAAVTAEPLPTRLASLALGTGDLDCVYHFALDELQDAILTIENEDQMDMLRTLVDGRRLRAGVLAGGVGALFRSPGGEGALAEACDREALVEDYLDGYIAEIKRKVARYRGRLKKEGR
jgi:hypothetical protein